MAVETIDEDKKTAPKRITFRLSEDLFTQVTGYVDRKKKNDPKYSLNDACIEALESLTNPGSPHNRYRNLLAFGRFTLRDHFTEAELNLIMDSCNGFMIMIDLGEGRILTQPGQAIALNVSDSIRLDRLDEKWGVDGKALVSKIAELDLPAQYALVDLIERFWDDPNTGSAISLL